MHDSLQGATRGWNLCGWSNWIFPENKKKYWYPQNHHIWKPAMQQWRKSSIDNDGFVTYQEAEMTNYHGVITFYVHTRLNTWKLYRTVCGIGWCCNMLMFSHTHWQFWLLVDGQKVEGGSFAHRALESLSTRFRVPLEKDGVDCSLIQEEWEDIVDYAKHYLNLVYESYIVIWWKLFNSVDANK